MKIVVATLLALTACNLNSRADTPVAVGSAAEMTRAIAAAQQCGATARLDPLDDERTLLLLASDSKPSACTLKWIRDEVPQTELTPAKRKEIGLS